MQIFCLLLLFKLLVNELGQYATQALYIRIHMCVQLKSVQTELDPGGEAVIQSLVKSYFSDQDL